MTDGQDLDDAARDFAADTEAWLRSIYLGERLGRFLAGEMGPLIEYVNDRGGDVREKVLLPTAGLLRRAADRLELGLDDQDPADWV